MPDVKLVKYMIPNMERDTKPKDWTKNKLFVVDLKQKLQEITNNIQIGIIKIIA